jgi:hypothetical protein
VSNYCHPATNKNYHDALKQHSPNVVANLEAIVAMGVTRAEALEKMREFTPVDVPDILWETVERTYDYLVLRAASGSVMN